MKRCFAAALNWALPLALAIAATPLSAQVKQQASPIDDLLKRAMDAYNDLQYTRADSLARQVLAVGPRITSGQRTQALMVLAAAAYPDDPNSQRRAVALSTLKQIVRTNLGLKMPQELTWAGLDSLVEEARRTTFGLEVTADNTQEVIGPQGTAHVSVRSSRPGTFQMTIMPASGGSAAVMDSLPVSTTGQFTFGAMRNDRPLFNTGEYSVIVTGVDAVNHDTVTVRYEARVVAPSLDFVNATTKVDSSKLLPEKTPRYGAKSIVPAVLVGAAAYALASSLRADDENIKTNVAADSKGVAIGGMLAAGTVAAGFLDRGRSIPGNIAANKAYVAAVQKSFADAQTENRRRVTDYKATFYFNSEAR
ncbi:MAG TPA: hypothetical protein VJ867_06540 [Gemmatimonadaceae bacterium]|nr:hypothetical protein [Gemmatimonadaceae bacterium]